MSLRDQVAARLDVRQFYESRGLTLQRGDKSHLKGLCPFHADREPSLSIREKDGWAHCFGCGFSGSLFDFEMKQTGRTFQEVLYALAEEFGVPAESGRESSGIVIDQGYVRRCQEALRAYPDGLAYLRDQRGFSDETIARFELGWDTRYRRFTLPMQNADGQLVGVKLYRVGGRPKWIWVKNGQKPPLFPWPNQDETEGELLEGEFDVILARQNGRTAWTGTRGAKTFDAESARAFAGKRVTVLYDRDEAGRTGSKKAARLLAPEKCEVRIAYWPEGEDDGYDLTDFLVRDGRSLDDLQALLSAAKPFAEPRSGRPREPQESEEEQRGSQADRLVSLVIAEGVELFHDQIGDTFAVVPVGGHREIWPCRGRHLKRWLAGRLWQAEGKAASSEALNAALNVIEAQARFDGPERELCNRVALHEGAIWYDLADRHWRAVRIAAAGWEVVADPPILFRRYSHQRPQREPLRGGDLRDLRPLVNLRDDSQFLLCQAYVVSCCVPDIPHPIPDVHGGQGTAKTTLLRMFRRLIDPSAVEVLSLPHDRKEFVQQLAHHWMPYYDNIADLSDWASDALCRASTGEGFSKRELYTDDDDVIYQFRRCPGLNGINVAARRPDLLERCLLLELDAIPRHRRRPERQLWREFEEARPRLLGAILDALSRAMALLDTVHLPELPRMADFAIWGCAIAEALGNSQDDFLAAYGDNYEARNDEALQASPVASMALALMEDREEWKGTASELLAELETLADQHRVNTRSADWPKAPNALSRELNKVRANLAVAGIGIERGSEGTHRWVRLRKMGGETVRTVRTVTGDSGDGVAASMPDAIAAGRHRMSSTESSQDEAAGNRGDDAGDGTDANDGFPWHCAEGVGTPAGAEDPGSEGG